MKHKKGSEFVVYPLGGHTTPRCYVLGLKVPCRHRDCIHRGYHIDIGFSTEFYATEPLEDILNELNLMLNQGIEIKDIKQYIRDKQEDMPYRVDRDDELPALADPPF